MKTLKIAVVVAIAGLVAFFWNDIKATVGSFDAGDKIEKSGVGLKSDKPGEAMSAEVTIKKKWKLPAVLTEISGLSYISGNEFACVQDELGKIFIYNTQTSELDKEIPFASPGDYEGIAIVNEAAWVLRADGRLFEIADYKNKPVVKEHTTHLTAEQNAEGLCYDKTNNRLLVAIKDEEPGNPGFKGIYGFDLNTRKMPTDPVIKIDMKDEVFKGMSSGKKKASVIKPSAIALHPSTNDIYITDGPKGKLLVMNKNGDIKKLYQLDNKEFKQPEGITFNATGELFISNEGAKQEGNILNVEITEE